MSSIPLSWAQAQELVRATVAEMLRQQQQQQHPPVAPPAVAAAHPPTVAAQPAATAPPRAAAANKNALGCVPTIILWDTVTCPPSGVAVHEIARRLRELTSRLLTPQSSPQIASVVSFVAFVEGSSALSPSAMAVLQECGVEPTVVSELTNKPCWELAMRTRVLQFMLEHGDAGFAVLVTSRSLQTVADLLTLRHQFRVHIVNQELWLSHVVALSVAIAPRRGAGADRKCPAVGVFWDVENIGRTQVAKKIMEDIQREFGVVTRAVAAAASINPHFMKEHLSSAGVTLIDEWNGAPRKEVADEILIHQMFEFCEAFPPPAAIVLISNDQDFIRPCSVLFNRGYVVVRIVCPNPTWPPRQWRIVEYITEHRVIDAIHTTGRSLAQAVSSSLPPLQAVGGAAPIPQTPPSFAVVATSPPAAVGGPVDAEPSTPLQFRSPSDLVAAGTTHPDTMLLEGDDSDDEDGQLMIRDELLGVYTTRLLQVIKDNVRPTIHPEDGSTLVRIIDREVLDALWLSKGMPYSRTIMNQLLTVAAEFGFLECDTTGADGDVRVFEDLLDAIQSERGETDTAAVMSCVDGDMMKGSSSLDPFDFCSSVTPSEAGGLESRVSPKPKISAKTATLSINQEDVADPSSIWAPFMVRQATGVVGDCLRHIYNRLMQTRKPLKWEVIASSLKTALSLDESAPEVQLAKKITMEPCDENKKNPLAFCFTSSTGVVTVMIRPWFAGSYMKRLAAAAATPSEVAPDVAAAAPPPPPLTHVRVEGVLIPVEEIEANAAIEYFRAHRNASLQYCAFGPSCTKGERCTYVHRRRQSTDQEAVVPPPPPPIPHAVRIDMDADEAMRVLGEVIRDMCAASPIRRCLVNMVGITFWQRMRRPTKKGLVKVLLDRGVAQGRWRVEKEMPSVAGGTEVWWVVESS